MASVTPGPPIPKAPTPKVRAIREIMRAFSALAIENDLGERNDFRTLDRIIHDTVVADNLLRALYIEFLRADTIELQIRFVIDWRTKTITVASGRAAPETVMLNAGAATAEGVEFVRIVSAKLFELRTYVQQMIVDEEYEEANWTIKLRDDDRNKDIARRCIAIQSKYGLVEPSPEYLAQRRDLEGSKPVTASFVKKSLNMLMRVIHRI